MRIKDLILLIIFFFTAITIPAQTVDELIAKGDEYSTKLFDNQKALEKYMEANKISPNNWEILWRISRAMVDIGEHMPSSTDAQKEAQLNKYIEAYNFASRAVKLAPDKSVTYLRRAIANGRIALFKGVFSVIGIVNEVKEDLERALKLGNGGNEILAACHYVYGRTHAKVCEKPYLLRVTIGLGWGDIEESIKHFKKAIELRPNFRMYRLDYAKVLISEEMYKEAKEQLYKIPAIPVSDEDDEKFLNESKKLLEQIKNK